jgi:hypothetical protein
MNTIAAIISIVKMMLNRQAWAEKQTEPIYPGGPTAVEYVEGMARPQGSFVQEVGNNDELMKMFEIVDASETIKDVTDDLDADIIIPGCRYYTAPTPEGYTSFEGIALIRELTVDELKSVRLMKGHHGVFFASEDIQPKPVDTLAFIEDDDGLRTWYPGRFTASVELSDLFGHLTQDQLDEIRITTRVGHGGCVQLMGFDEWDVESAKPLLNATVKLNAPR